MSIDFSKIEAGADYEVEIGDKSFKVKGADILSALCPACGGCGQVSVEDAEPQVCELCSGLGMFDYTQARQIKPV